MKRASAAAVMAAGLALAGCGGSSSHSSTATITNPAVRSQLARCEATVSAQAVLPQSVKQQLDTACVAAARGDKATARRIAAQLCPEVVHDAVPASKQRAALAACPKR